MQLHHIKVKNPNDRQPFISALHISCIEMHKFRFSSVTFDRQHMNFKLQCGGTRQAGASAQSFGHVYGQVISGP